MEEYRIRITFFLILSFSIMLLASQGTSRSYLNKSWADPLTLDNDIKIQDNSDFDQKISTIPSQDSEVSEDNNLTDEVLIGDEVSEDNNLTDEVLIGDEVSEDNNLTDEVLIGDEVSEDNNLTDEVLIGDEVSEDNNLTDEVSNGGEVLRGNEVSEDNNQTQLTGENESNQTTNQT